MRLLVLRGGALGDFLVTLPALALLRQRWPDAHIELVGNATAAALGVAAGLLNAVHSQHESRWSALYSTARLPASLADWLAEFDVVVSYWPDPDRTLARHFPLRPTQVFLAAEATPALAPAAAHFCAPLQQLGLVPPALSYRLRTAPRDAGLIALHPGSGSRRKNWPLARWRSLATWLESDLGRQVLVMLGEAEPADALAGVGRHLRSLSLGELANRVAGCGLFIGHDSGISHLAAACGVPCVLLFGPTDPAIWAPPAPAITVLQRGPDPAAISLAEVQATVRAALQAQN